MTHAALPDELEPPELDEPPPELGEPPVTGRSPALADGLAAAEWAAGDDGMLAVAGGRLTGVPAPVTAAVAVVVAVG